MGLGSAVSKPFAGLLRLLAPVFWLGASYAVALAALSYPIATLDPYIQGRPGAWLTAAHLAIMLPFFVSMLSNRARGPAFAFAQLILTWLTIGSGAVYLAMHPVAGIPAPDLAGLRHNAPLLGILFASHIANILMFDSMRGVPWWRAPFIGGLMAAIVMAGLYWLVLGRHATLWPNRLGLDMGLKAATALLLMVPFAMLRGIARPRNGFGGY